MSISKSLPQTVIFQIIRLTPFFCALGFIDLSDVPFERASLFFDRFLRAFTVLVLWSLTEGVFMLWVREKNAGSEKTRGYGAVTCILGLIVLIALQVFRAQTAQAQFLLLLAALAMRGMSRSGWEQGRAQVSAITAPLSHTCIALLSFMLLLDTLTWQVIVIGTALGLLTGALEITWYASTFGNTYPSWLLPLYRLSISFPAVAIGSLSLIRQLPPYYFISLATLLLSTRFTWNQGRGDTISDTRFMRLAGIYFLFMLLVVGACLYS
jgi:hypothetical protein